MKLYEIYGLNSDQNIQHVNLVLANLDKLTSEFGEKNFLKIDFKEVGFNNEYLNSIACRFLTKDKPRTESYKNDDGFFVFRN